MPPLNSPIPIRMQFFCTLLHFSLHPAQTDVFVVCFSVSSSDSRDNVRTKWMPEVRAAIKANRETEEEKARAAKGSCKRRIPVLLVGTKTDLRNCGGGGRATSTQPQPPCSTAVHGHALARDVGADKYVECSAATQDNVVQVFEEAVRLALWPGRGAEQDRGAWPCPRRDGAALCCIV